MTRQRVTTRVITLLVVTLVLLGLWQTGSGAWIYVKAKLAQVLLQRAWAGTLAGQRDTHFQFLERLHGGETLLVQTRTAGWV